MSQPLKLSFFLLQRTRVRHQQSSSPSSIKKLLFQRFQTRHLWSGYFSAWGEVVQHGRHMGQRKTTHLTVANRQRIWRKDLTPHILPGPYPGDISSYKTLLLKSLSTISSRLHWDICFGRPLKTNHSNDKQVNNTGQGLIYKYRGKFIYVCIQ